MGVMSSMATAISGLEANGTLLGVISDNIVNTNTMGFKSSRGEFHSVLAQDLLGSVGGSQIGHGVRLGGTMTNFGQGPITRTDRNTDLAVNGTGFFVLKGNKGLSYTRDGSFEFDKEGWLTTLGGARVQAYLADREGVVTGKMGDLRIPFRTVPAKPTTEAEIHFNLDSRLKVALPMDLERPEETAQFKSGLTIYDSIGNAHAVNLYASKTADSTWEWNALVDGGELAGGVEGQPSVIASGTLIFDQEGKLQTSEQALVDTSFANGAVADQALNFNFGDPIDDLGTGAIGTTQYGTKSSIIRAVQNGYGAGMLSDAQVDADGVVAGIYTNGVTRPLGQLALARFESAERLQKIGENQFRESLLSGQPLLSRANANGIGHIMSKSLEASNVDLAKEFVDMIKAQRGFQASAKSINVADQMLDEVINIKHT